MRRYRPFSYCCIRQISTRSLTTTTIYPCHSAGGTVRAFIGVRPPFIQGSFLRLNMPSADSRYAMGSPCGSLTRRLCKLSSPIVCVSQPFGSGSSGGMTRNFPDARVLFYRFPLYSGMFQLQFHTRRNGPPGVITCLSAHERRVYVSGL